MMSLEVLGTVRPYGTLELHERLSLPPGRVKVRIESLEPSPEKPAESLVEFVQRLRREMKAAGHQFRTKDEIDAEIEELRKEWEERPAEVDRTRSQPSGHENLGC